MQSGKSLSNIELYFSEIIKGNIFEISSDEFKHAAKVMRHKIGHEIYSTDGNGKIYQGKISYIFKDSLHAEIEHTYSYKNEFKNIIFCLPKLKNPARFEFALEKCVELGITRFIVFDSGRSIAKGSKIERWNKILMAAMKQSLRSYLPSIEVKSLTEVSHLSGEKICFDQNSDKKLIEFQIDHNKNYYFIFGPEGGLTEDEIYLFKENVQQLTSNRLRSETAILTAAAILSTKKMYFS